MKRLSREQNTRNWRMARGLRKFRGFRGVWANSNTVEECRKELISVLEEWLILKLRDQNPIPEIDGLSLEIREMAVG